MYERVRVDITTDDTRGGIGMVTRKPMMNGKKTTQKKNIGFCAIHITLPMSPPYAKTPTPAFKNIETVHKPP
jgi:hypothetical protein